MKTKVYIASPYTKGDVAVNVKRQMDMADTLMTMGYAPFAPLYSHFQHMTHPRPYADWIAIDLEWVPACDVVLRLDGDSSGADGEVAFARERGIPVVSSVDELRKRFPAGLSSPAPKEAQEPTEAQITAALEAGCWFDTPQSRKDVRRALMAAAGVVPEDRHQGIAPSHADAPRSPDDQP